MKHIQSTTEGTWIELIKATITEEQQTLIKSTDISDNAAKETLLLQIKSNSEVALASEDKVIAEAIYTANKPVLEEGDTYQLISVNMTLDEGAARGIINCRINGEHKQIRF